ncbi:hypothetical protein [Amycolatopsis sp. cmx-4-83]|uniref:hypothetical protein n=1 Tax=Amycolatopsis sp. cmx-4-83 TaxID=2790940 RepID=UPI00397A1595
MTAELDLYRTVVTASLPTILDHAPVALRHPALKARFAAAAAAVRGFRSTVDSEAHTPEIVASATESGANVFGIDHFGRPAYLAQYTSLDAELGFVRDHHDVMAVLRDVLAGMAGDLVTVPAEIRRSTSPRRRTSSACRPTSRTSRPREHGSEFLFAHRLPDGETAVLHAPGTGPATRTASTCCSAAWSW